MKFNAGDKVKAHHEIDYVIPTGTKGVVKAAHPRTHSSFPYDVLFKGDEKTFPVAEYEIIFDLPWYRRLWERVALHNPVK